MPFLFIVTGYVSVLLFAQNLSQEDVKSKESKLSGGSAKNAIIVIFLPLLSFPCTHLSIMIRVLVAITKFMFLF